MINYPAGATHRSLSRLSRYRSVPLVADAHRLRVSQLLAASGHITLLDTVSKRDVLLIRLKASALQT